MIIDLVIPKQSLIPITPPKSLGPNILIREFDLFLGERTVGFMIVMFAVQFVGVEYGDEDSGEGNVKGYLSPEVYIRQGSAIHRK